MIIQSVWKILTCLQKAKFYSQLNTSGVTLNADLETTHYQTWGSQVFQNAYRTNQRALMAEGKTFKNITVIVSWNAILRVFQARM